MKVNKNIIILGHDEEYLGQITVNSLSTTVRNYILNIIEENYQQSILGDLNGDGAVNIQDIILLLNMILDNNNDSSGDINADGYINILDVVQLVSFILIGE